MLKRAWRKFVNSRETLPVALTATLESYRLVYSYNGTLINDSVAVIASIEDDLILTIYFATYIPKEKKAKVFILDKQGKKRGALHIQRQDTFGIDGKQAYFYKVTTARSQIPYLYSILMNHLVYAAKRKLKYHLKEGKRLHDLFVYYIKPRPVFLLSVQDADRFDIFPVDLTGHIFNNYYTLAIKSTNQAIELIKKAGGFCLSAVPLDKVDVIYKHHEQRKKGKVTLDSLTFFVAGSRVLKIPVPDFAIMVREFKVEDTIEKGQYTLLIIKCINEYPVANNIALAHAPWYTIAKKQKLSFMLKH